MFCPTCGTQIASDSTFCPNCGTAVAHSNAVQPQQAYQPNAYPQNVHMNYPANGYQANGNPDLQQLYQAEKYAGALQPYLDQIENLKELKKNRSTALIEAITGAVLLVLFGILSIVFFSKGGLSTILAVVFLCCTISAGVIFVVFLIKMLGLTAKFPPGGCDAEIRRLQEEFDHILANDPQLQQSFRVFQGLFPYGATYDQVSFMIKMIETRRANNFTEALNLYDQHVHMQNMEQLAREQNMISQDIARSAQRAAQAAEESAMYNRINMFK